MLEASTPPQISFLEVFISPFVSFLNALYATEDDCHWRERQLQMPCQCCFFCAVEDCHSKERGESTKMSLMLSLSSVNLAK